jgi:DNA-binding PadR family transcriptional regulator
MSPTQRIGSVRQVDFLVLAVLVDGPLHGYGIVQALAELTDGRVELRPGDVYRILYRMRKAGLIEPVTDGAEADAGRRSTYRITQSGRDAAADQAKLMAGVSAQLLGGLER